MVNVAAVVVDDVLWIDGDVPLGGIQIEVAQELRCNVDRQAPGLLIWRFNRSNAICMASSSGRCNTS